MLSRARRIRAADYTPAEAEVLVEEVVERLAATDL
jgi:hypothetical protein